jgi:hypothetical protein
MKGYVQFKSIAVVDIFVIVVERAPSLKTKQRSDLSIELLRR